MAAVDKRNPADPEIAPDAGAERNRVRGSLLLNSDSPCRIILFHGPIWYVLIRLVPRPHQILYVLAQGAEVGQH